LNEKIDIFKKQRISQDKQQNQPDWTTNLSKAGMFEAVAMPGNKFMKKECVRKLD